MHATTNWHGRRNHNHNKNCCRFSKKIGLLVVVAVAAFAKRKHFYIFFLFHFYYSPYILLQDTVYTYSVYKRMQQFVKGNSSNVQFYLVDLMKNGISEVGCDNTKNHILRNTSSFHPRWKMVIYTRNTKKSFFQAFYLDHALPN